MINTSALTAVYLTMVYTSIKIMNKETSSWKNWFTGFTDGEGSFCISFTLRKKMKLGIEVRPSFSIAQHKTSLACLELILSNFNCGGIRFNKIDQTYKYEIRNIKDLNDIIIPHFEKYGLLTIKQKDFLKFNLFLKIRLILCYENTSENK